VPTKTLPAEPGARKKNGIGRSRGGRTTKIHARVDALGLLVALQLTPGQAHDSVKALDLIDAARADALIMDKAYDTNSIRERLTARDEQAVIPSRSNRNPQLPHDSHLYKERHRVENFFQRIKRYRKLATRYAKNLEMFRGAICLVAIVDWLA